jgi:Family of unknown function (DUF5681)
MNDIVPPWGTDWKPTPPPVQADGKPWQFQPGQSGNPRGRPPGRPDRRLLATESMLEEMRGIVAVLIGKALEGDTNAASIVLAKTLPSIKAQAEKVNFDFDATAPISEQVAQVLDAIAAGALAPDVGRLVIDSIKALADVKASELLEARIEALEAASDARR